MAKSEDVQYFQFDQSGNMYVFEPGAGFSGVCKKVSPGEDFNGKWAGDVHCTSELYVPDSGFVSVDSSQFDSQYECTQFIVTQDKYSR